MNGWGLKCRAAHPYLNDRQDTPPPSPRDSSYLSQANMPSVCYLRSSVTRKFTEYLLLTDVCQQQISRILAIDMTVTSFFLLKRSSDVRLHICYNNNH